MDYNPFLPAVTDNPHPYYAYLRQHAPVYQIPSLGWWAVARYDDVLTITRDHDVFSSEAQMAKMLEADLNFAPGALNGIDPPVHTRLRKLANRAFTPRMVAGLESRMRARIDQLAAGLIAEGQGDLITEFASPLPTLVIAEMLGVEPERCADFEKWTYDITMAMSRYMSGQMMEEERQHLRYSINALQTYIRDMIAARSKEPKDDLISALVKAQEEDQKLTSEEVFNLAIFILYAGSETTTNLIGNAVLALWEHPGEFAKVRANPALIPNLVEETLRYNGPGQWFPRQTTCEAELSGTKIPAGATVLPLFASANRDERKFPDPDRFDVTRNTEGHLGFGHGIHFCLGVDLARMEARFALETLLFRCPPFSCTSAPIIWNGGALIHGPKTVPLAFTTK